MDKLDTIIAEEAATFRQGRPHSFQKIPQSVDDISETALAEWARKILRSLELEANDPLLQRSSEPADANRQARLLLRAFRHLISAPVCSSTAESLKRLSDEVLLHAWQLLTGPGGANPESDSPETLHKHPKSKSFAFFCLMIDCVSAAALLEASGLSRSKACERVSQLIAKYGITASADTIRKDWFGKIGDPARLHHSEEHFSSPRLMVRVWFDDLEKAAWRDPGDPRLSSYWSDFVAFANSQRADLITRYIPERLEQACISWRKDKAQIGEKGV